MKSKKEYIEKNINLIYEMIKENKPKMEIARVLNVKYETLAKHLKALGIEYQGNQSGKGIADYLTRKPIEYYLKEKMIIAASTLRKKLIVSGLKEERCECCGLSEWMGKKIPLELHHLNGNHYDNRLENLQILCPNCHMIAHNYNNTKKDKKNNNTTVDK